MPLSSFEVLDEHADSKAATASLAAGGFVASLLASSCCILPLVLVSLGLGGTWLSYLTALSPYQPYFLGTAALSIGIGLWRVYHSPNECLPGSFCARPASGQMTKLALWIGASLVAAAAAADFVAPHLG